MLWWLGAVEARRRCRCCCLPLPLPLLLANVARRLFRGLSARGRGNNLREGGALDGLDDDRAIVLVCALLSPACLPPTTREQANEMRALFSAGATIGAFGQRTTYAGGLRPSRAVASLQRAPRFRDLADAAAAVPLLVGPACASPSRCSIASAVSRADDVKGRERNLGSLSLSPYASLSSTARCLMLLLCGSRGSLLLAHLQSVCLLA